MQSAENWRRQNASASLNAPRYRRVLVQGKMRARAIIIFHVGEEYVAQVSLAEDDDMIKAFPSDRSDHPFRMSILPWRLWRGWPVTNAHGAKPPFEKRAVDAVAITNDVPRYGVPAAGLGKLPRNPFRHRMRRHSQP